MKRTVRTLSPWPSLRSLSFLFVVGVALTGCHRRARVVYAVPADSVAVESTTSTEGSWVWTGQKYEWQAAASGNSVAIRPVYPHAQYANHVLQPGHPQPTYVVDRHATRRAQRAYKRALKQHRRELKRHQKLMRRYHRDMARQGYSTQGTVYVYGAR